MISLYNINMCDNLTSIVNDLFIKYQNNPTIREKLVQTIENLPTFLENANNTILERAERKSKLESDSETFIHKFLHNNKFYYNTTSELFFEYKNNKYMLVKEDDVQHCILSTLSTNKALTDWKHKLKITILKKIKERDIFTCIPESETIQNVINRLSASICDNKEKAKYFLTVLGDILLKKCNLIYFANSKTKQFIKELNNLSCILFGTPNLLHYFKFKYYEHTFTECRNVDIQEFVNIENWNTYFKQEQALDLFCVATYYSSRYENGDTFLQEHCKDDELKKYALYLKNSSDTKIIDKFCEKNIEHSDDCSISWKNMQYLWKRFIESEKLPNVFFSTALKTHLLKKLKYNETDDVYLDCTSTLLPIVSKFIQFWTDNIEINDKENDTCTDTSTFPCQDDTSSVNINEELEIDELCSLFTHHTKHNMNEKHILDLIRHYYPDTLIEDDKYILNASCKLWNKKQDIIKSLQKYKTSSPSENITSAADEISINELYQFYCKSKKKFIVSKRYFENFIKEESDLYIVENDFIKVNSFTNI
jgi:hypothetical protein